MSDTSQGDGWWQASDGKWYPPEQHPGASARGAADDPAAPGDPTRAQPAAASPPGDPTRAQPAASSPPDDPTQAQPAAATPPGGDPTTVQPAAPGGPTAPPPAPPPAPTPGGPPPGRGRGKLIAGVAVVFVLLVAAFVALTVLGDDEAAAGEVMLEPVGTSGPDPFTEPVAPSPSGSLRTFADSGSAGDAVNTGSEGGRGGYREVEGTAKGVFGGTLDEASCDVAQLSSFLSAETEKAEAWAGVLKIDPADIDVYLDGLTAANLASDTRVLNHGFVDGEVDPRESVLQRGTAVLVDDRGVPRVSCYCGNPLTEAASIEAGERYEGEPWSSFEPAAVLVVEEAPAPASEFELVDVETGDLFVRPAGSTGEADRDIVDATSDDDEPGSDGPIEFNTRIEDSLEGTRTEANYTLDAPDGAVMVVTLENQRDSDRAVLLELSLAGDRLVAMRVNPGAEDSEQVVFDHDDGDLLDLRISDGPAAFAFEVSLEVQDDAGSGGDAPDELVDAVEIDGGQEVTGLLAGRDRSDHYTLELEPGSELGFVGENDVTSTGGALFEIQLNGERLFAERAQQGTSVEDSILLAAEDGGTLEVIVNDGGGPYSFTVTFAAQNDGGAPGDAGSDLASAREVTGGPIGGEVGNRDRTDFYLAPAPSTTPSVEISVAADAERALVFEVQNANGDRVLAERVNPGASFTGDFETEGDTLRIIVTEGRGTYQITFS